MHGRGQLLSFLTGLWRWCHLALTVHLWDGHRSKGPVALEMNFCSNQEKGPEFFKIILIYLSSYLFMTVLGLCCCTGFSLLSASGGSSLVVVCGLLIEVASIVEHGL